MDKMTIKAQRAQELVRGTTPSKDQLGDFEPIKWVLRKGLQVKIYKLTSFTSEPITFANSSYTGHRTGVRWGSTQSGRG